MHDLRATLAGFSEWVGYGHGERAGAWLQRLEINAPELAYFRQQLSPPYPPYRPATAKLAPPSGATLPAQPPLRTDAAEALVRAARQSELNALTYTVDRVPAHQTGYLAGVPIVVKDLMAVEGAPLSGGSAASDDMPSTRDAEVVARLKRAGAVVIGTANLHEYAYGITSDNPRFGRVVNPVARARIPGGSSGGSAAAIAAGIVQAAVGSDTAGSIRVPAACCGIVGFKPSYDAVPRTGAVDLACSLDHIGPMGRTVDACATLFSAMLALPEVPRWAYRDLSGKKFARLRGYFEEPLDSEVRAALDEALASLEDDGARCISAQIEGIESAAAIQFNTICAEATEVHAQRLFERGHELGEDVRVRLEIGLFLPGHWYIKAQRMRQQLAERTAALFDEADLLICPTMRAPAPAVDAGQVEIEGHMYPLHTAVTQLTMPFNLTGLPAISVPWGSTSDGVPIGLQIVGRSGDDWQVLAAAQRVEALSPAFATGVDQK